MNNLERLLHQFLGYTDLCPPQGYSIALLNLKRYQQQHENQISHFYI